MNLELNLDNENLKSDNIEMSIEEEKNDSDNNKIDEYIKA